MALVVFSMLGFLSMARGTGQSVASIRAANLKSLIFITVKGTYANNFVDISTGTGFIVGPGGYVLTCNHVVLPKKSEYRTYEITGCVGGRHEFPYPLAIIHSDEQLDLMLLKLPDNPEGSWRSVESIHEAQLGTRIVAFGFPMDQDVVDAEGSITGNHSDGRWLTDAGLNRGMSGGPAFDLDGAVVGIVAGGYEEANALRLLIPIRFSTTLLQLANSPLLSLKPGAQSQGRCVIVCDFSADLVTADKDEPLRVLTRKITRLSEKILADCSEDLAKDHLLSVAKLEVKKNANTFANFDVMKDFWNKDPLVLEIIDGSIVTKKDPSQIWSVVHLFGLQGSLKQPTITIATEMTGPNLGSVEDLHCAVALYALAMDLKHRYGSLTDGKEKRRYIAIINLYLAKIRGYLPPSVANADELRKNQEELSNELWEAAVKELDWCKKEAGNL